MTMTSKIIRREAGPKSRPPEPNLPAEHNHQAPAVFRSF